MRLLLIQKKNLTPFIIKLNISLDFFTILI